MERSNELDTSKKRQKIFDGKKSEKSGNNQILSAEIVKPSQVQSVARPQGENNNQEKPLFYSKHAEDSIASKYESEVQSLEKR